MRPSLQLIDTATITQHNRNDKALGIFYEAQDFRKAPSRIRALHTGWNQVKKLSETPKGRHPTTTVSKRKGAFAR